MDARERRFGQLHLRLDGRGVQRRADHRLHLLPHLRVVAIARHVDHRGVETTESIAAEEHPDALALVQIHDAAHDADQFADVRLEKLVAWIGFEHVHDGLGVMTRRIEAEMIDDAFDLVTQQRDLARTAVVDGRGEQTQKTPLSADASRLVERLEADVVEVRRAMYGGDRVCLCDREQFDFACVLTQRARQCGRLHASAASGAQNAKSRLGQGLKDVFGPAALQAVLAVAKEREMVVRHPFNERLDLTRLVRRDRRRRILDLRRDVESALTNGQPVGDGELHIPQRALDAFFELVQSF